MPNATWQQGQPALKRFASPDHSCRLYTADWSPSVQTIGCFFLVAVVCDLPNCGLLRMGPKLEQLLKDVENGLRPTKVDLFNEGLTDFPDILYRIKDSLEFINFGGNKLSSLPGNLVEFRNLKILFFANNNFTAIPECLGQLPYIRMLSFKSNKVAEVPEASLSASLQWLILTDNQITELPKSIGKLSGLRKLMLSGNRLTHLPIELHHCRDLELCRLACNCLTHLPDWFVKLPKLTWLAYSGNLIKSSREVQRTSEVRWDALRVGEKLGEGASGTVYKAQVSCDVFPDGAEKEYAMKVFKGEITSDGLAEDEIIVNELLSTHPRFIKVLARITHHPEDKLALLFPLLPTNVYCILGQPPSFDSITRDTFASGTVFTLPYVLNVLKGVAEACAHLAELHVLHGDVYAHNILTSQDGEGVLLTDFGAASFYECAGDGSDTESLEGIEVRAYSCLVEDLLDRLASEDAHHELVRGLRALIERCRVDDAIFRPRFREVVQFVSGLKI